MPVHDPSGPPPDPRDLADFEALTARLRELFAWCGSPKYASLSQSYGLAPSAISGLIGKRPSRRPGEATTTRFVEACLLRGGMAPDDAATEVERWRETWRRLDAVDGDPGTAPAAAAPDAHDTQGVLAAPRRPRRPLLLAAGVAVIVLVVAVATLGMSRLVGGSGAASAGSPRSVCHRTEIKGGNDVRNSRIWHTAFRCPTSVGAPVRLHPTPGSPVVSRMRTPMSWYVCWTRGKEHAGGNAIWYYTQGDDKLSAYPNEHSWGFVAASDLGTEKDPDPRAFRRCPQDTPAL